jgi:hypothetical protein
MSIDFEELKLDATPVASGGFGTVWHGQWRGLDVYVFYFDINNANGVC